MLEIEIFFMPHFLFPRLSLAPQVIAAEKSLAKNSVKTAVTASQVMERHKASVIVFVIKGNWG